MIEKIKVIKVMKTRNKMKVMKTENKMKVIKVIKIIKTENKIKCISVLMRLVSIRGGCSNWT